MIANKSVEIQEQEHGTYVFPAVDLKQTNYSWALYVFPDGSAELYTRRSETGALLGKPIKVKAPTKRSRPCDHDLKPDSLMTGNKDFTCHKCTKRFRLVQVGPPRIYAERVRNL